MIELRDYQRDLLEQVQKVLDPEKARIMVQLPTCGGKTVIAAHLLAGYLTDGRKALWLTHRKELAGQTGKALTKAAGVLAHNNSRWAVGKPAPAIANGVMILMAQSTSRRIAKRDIWSRYGEDDLMVIDEGVPGAAPVSNMSRGMSKLVKGQVSYAVTMTSRLTPTPGASAGIPSQPR